METEIIIKTTDVSGNMLSESQRKFMFLHNLMPVIDLSKKSWMLEKVLRTDTPNVPWLISYDNQYYVAIQSNNRRFGSNGVSFYPSDEKGNYEISLQNQIKRLYNYIDMESACDEFIDDIIKNT